MLISSDILGYLMCQVLHKGLQVQGSQAGSFPLAGRLVHASRTKTLGRVVPPTPNPYPRRQAQGFCLGDSICDSGSVQTWDWCGGGGELWVLWELVSVVFTDSFDSH